MAIKTKTPPAKAEANRLKRIMKKAGISDQRMKLLQPVIENVSWMRVKLDETRKMISSSGVAVEYDNGGGQSGIRESPWFKGYEALWKSYMIGMGKLLDVLPPEDVAQIMAAEPEKPKTVLEIIQSKHKKEA